MDQIKKTLFYIVRRYRTTIGGPSVMPEGIKLWGPVVIAGDNLPFSVGIGLTDMPNIGVPVAPTGDPPGSGITEYSMR